MSKKGRDTKLPPPFLKRVWLPEEAYAAGLETDNYPFSIPLIKNSGLDLSFSKSVTILVGENGSGKSTVLEAIASLVGFDDGGGATGMSAVGGTTASGGDGGLLGRELRASWLPRVGRGWFFRAETFFSVARYLDDAGSDNADFLSHSHGEGFLRFFDERLDRQGVYIFDEPESALSPQKQFAFMKRLRAMQRSNNCQVIMATHSPILMALPDSDLWQLDDRGVWPTRLEDTSHFRIYREFVAYPHETVEAMID